MSVSPSSRDLLIVDDHPIITSAVADLVAAHLPGCAVHAAHTAATALELAERHRPGVAVVDISLPDGDGLDLIGRLRERAPGCRALVFSVRNELQFGPLALRAGASGYVMKGEEVGVLADAIRKIEAGGIHASPALSEQLVRGMSRDEAAGIARFSNRELQVFRLLAEGNATKEIARKLRISTKTVDSHIEHMKEKLECPSKTDLLLRARDWLRDGGETAG